MILIRGTTGNGQNAAKLAWLAASLFYFYQYVLRSAPAVMVPQLTHAFGVSAAGLTALLGLFYFAYAPFSLVAGVAMDQLGPRKVTPIAAAAVGGGAALFATGNPSLAAIGSFLQGGGAVFAFVAAVFIASSRFPATQAATLIGSTQMLGMAGGSAGLFLIGPAIAAGLQWDKFWTLAGFTGLALAGLLLVLIPRQPASVANSGPAKTGDWIGKTMAGFGSVFRNPQSILCGFIAGLLFIPTTIFGMVWGVQFLQESYSQPYTVAVMRSASVPVGWIIGAPLLGALSDRIGRRKPIIVGAAAVLLACLALILHGKPGLFPAYSLGLAAGIASGAAMLPYTVIKEANRPEYSGTATGVISFINFSLSALVGPMFGALLVRASAGGQRELSHYQAAFDPLLYIVGLAIILTLFLRETGPASRPATMRAEIIDITSKPSTGNRFSARL